MTAGDLGYNALGIKTISNTRRMTSQEFRNNVQFADVRAKSAYIGLGDAVFKADENGIYLGNEEFASAPFSVDMDGNLIATLATISGAISSSTVDIGGADATSFHVDVDGNLWSGAALLASAPFKVTNAGALTSTNATISGAISGSTIDIGGADATSFHVDVDGNMWLGAATYATAPSKISNAGALTAQSVTIKDSNGTSVVDSSGLVSSTQFSSGSHIGTGAQTTASEDWIDVTGLTTSFTLARTQSAFLFGQINAYNDDYLNGYSVARMIVDSTQVSIIVSSATTMGLIFGNFQDTLSLAAGSHTVKLQVKRYLAGNTVVALDQSIVGYLTLGK